MVFPLSMVPTCPKNRNNRGFLRFPDTGILTTIAILRTARFTLIVKIADVWDVWDSTFKVEMIPILPITSYKSPTVWDFWDEVFPLVVRIPDVGIS